MTTSFPRLLLALLVSATCVQADSISVLADFDDLTSAPFYAAPQLGLYGGFGGTDEGPPGLPRVPTPYQGLRWTNFFVMNNSSATHEYGHQHATPILTPCSGDNIAIAYKRTTKRTEMDGPREPVQHILTLNYTGNTANSFALTGFCAACFIDIDGKNQGHYGVYYKDEKTAVDCDLRFTARRGSAAGQETIAMFNYTKGCETSVKGCTEQYRPMQTFNGDAVEKLGQAYAVDVEVEAVYYDGSVEGYHFSGRKAIMIALDSVTYTLYE